MKNAIDLYSGIGGWTLGMKLSGINNVASFEWWHEANQTHNLNFGTNHKEVNIRNINVETDLNFVEKIDFIVGSPPCTQFSMANRGGNGDIKDGLVDIIKFLEVVEYLKPKYWAMENVPRVAKILEKELNGGSLSRFKKLFTVIEVVDAAEYGAPQNRKRMIAGNFPNHLFSSYKKNIPQISLGEVLENLNKEIIQDPNYGYKIPKIEVTELENEVDLTVEEARINCDAKTFHPIYNGMSFPDKLNRPSRTITATCTRVSRESIIIKSETGYRRLNVRERGVLQGFPITYQFYGRTLNAKFKMIGNAVPPVLTYYIIQSMLEVCVDKILPPRCSNYHHEKPKFKAYTSKMGLPVRKYPAKRKFQFSVPNLRYGSGVRFELSNTPNIEPIEWSFKFYYGNSKKIMQIPLDIDIKNSLAPIVNTTKNHIFTDKIEKLSSEFSDYSPNKLQDIWISSTSNNEVFDFLDKIGEEVEEIINTIDISDINDDLIESLINEKNKKLIDNKKSLLVGFYLLSNLNQKIFKK